MVQGLEVGVPGPLTKIRIFWGCLPLHKSSISYLQEKCEENQEELCQVVEKVKIIL